jgi:cytochrome c
MAAAMLVAAIPLAGSALESGATAPTVTVSRGERLFLQCRACHTLRPGEPHTVGPNLAGFFGRSAATADGYAYSAALRQSSLVWDDATLDRWLASPSALVPGTSMAFVGLPDAGQRGALIAWLRTASAN